MPNQQSTAEEAYAKIHQKVYVPVFFNKLAQDFHIVPADVEEQAALLDMGIKLAAASEDLAVKQAQDAASSRKSFLKSASAELDNMLGLGGATSQTQQPGMSQQVKVAAEVISADPELAGAMLQILQSVA